MKRVYVKRQSISKLLLSNILAFSILLSNSTFADDVDVYLGATTNNVGVQPNVLFILDTSGSMAGTIGNGDSTVRMVAMKEAMVEILSSANNLNVGLATFNSTGGPIRLPVRDIDATLNIDEGFQVVRTIANGNDDAQEIDAGTESGQIDIDSKRIYLSEGPALSATINSLDIPINNYLDQIDEVVTGGGQYLNDSEFWITPSYISGMRFQNVLIDPGSPILSARVKMHTSRDSSQQNTSVMITGEAADTASSLVGTGQLNNLFTNSATTNSHEWVFSTGWLANQDVYTSDISPIIQEIIDRPGAPSAGWQSGNALNLIFQSANAGRFYGDALQSNNANAATAPRLEIDYIANAGNGSAKRKTGLRFQDVRIPQGATIVEAYISVKSEKASSEALDLTISAELSTDSQPFTASTNDISSRSTTISATTWNLTNADVWEAGQRYQSPNLANVVQQVVNQNAWCGGNALSLFIEDATSVDGRTFYTFEGATDVINDVPILEVKYDLTGISASETGCTLRSITRRTDASADDVDEGRNSGNMNLTRQQLNLGDRNIGLVFGEIDLPQGATIVSANVEFTTRREQNNDPVNALIVGEAVDTATLYPDTSNGQVSERVTNRPTSNQVAWNNVPSLQAEETANTPDIAGIVEEIVNRPNWVAGNAIGLMFKDQSSSGVRSYYSYERAAAASPRLVIEAKVNLDATTVEGETVREHMINEVNSLVASGLTPVTDVLYEGIQYFRGDGVDWGAARGGGFSWNRWSRVSHPDTYENATGVYRDANCTDSDLNNPACVSEQIQGTANYITPIENACQSNYIVVLTDGSQNGFRGRDRVNALTGGSCNNDTTDGPSNCGYQLAQYANTIDLSDTGPVGSNALTGDQTATIYTIGFTSNSNPVYMQGLADYGGGTYFPAASASELKDVFRQITSDILSQPSTFTAPALSVNAFNQLYNTKDVYVSLFEPNLSRRWDGNIKKYQLCVNDIGEVLICDATNQALTITDTETIRNDAVSFWGASSTADPDGPNITVGGAGNQVLQPADRRLFTYTDNTQPKNVDLGLNKHLLAKSNTNLTPALLGVPGNETDDLIDWIRGIDNGPAGDNGGPYTDSRWVYADALHSAAVSVTYGGDATNGQIDKLLIGTNDGFVRMINTDTGIEEWAFMPQKMLQEQSALRNNAAGNRLYGMDGSPVVRRYDSDLDGVIDPAKGEFLHAYFGMRRGGNSYYALDISPSSVVTNRTSTTNITPKLLWRIDGGTGDFVHLGQTWSTPQHATINITNTSGNVEAKDVVIFAGGYDDANDVNVSPTNIGNAIYIVDAETGERIWWASNAGSGANLQIPGMDFSIPSDLTLLDMDLDGNKDRIIVGDIGGNLWRIDLLNTMKVNSSTTLGGIAHKVASIGYDEFPTDNQNHRRFMYPVEVLINDGSTDFNNPANSIDAHMLIVANTGNRAAPSGTTEQNAIYGFKDKDYGRYSDSNNDGLADGVVTITMSDMTNIYNDLNSAANNYEASTASNNGGWYLPLAETTGSYIGEKAISGGSLVKTSDQEFSNYYIASTYFPAGAKTGTVSPCSAELGSTKTYVLKISDSAVGYDTEESTECANCAPPPPPTPAVSCEANGDCPQCEGDGCGNPPPADPNDPPQEPDPYAGGCASDTTSTFTNIGSTITLDAASCYYPSYWITE